MTSVRIMQSLLLGLLLFATAGYGFSPTEILEESWLAEDFALDNHEVEGVWEEKQVWKERLCRNCYYKYRVRLKGDIADIDFELNADKRVDVYADIHDISGFIGGNYRSTKTLCVPLWTGMNFQLDRAQIWSEISFTDKGESLSELQVEVIETRLGTIRLGKYAPQWLEKSLTKMVNYALAGIWKSRLGSWLSKEITEYIKKKLPIPDPDEEDDMADTYEELIQRTWLN